MDGGGIVERFLMGGVSAADLLLTGDLADRIREQTSMLAKKSSRDMAEGLGSNDGPLLRR